MAKSKADPPKPCLLQASPAEARAKLEARLAKGKELQRLPGDTPAAFEVFEAEHRKWNDYNETLLAGLFTTNDEMIKYRWSVSGGGVIVGRPSPYDEYRRRLEGLIGQCNALESLIERIEVIPLAPGVSATGTGGHNNASD